MAFRSFGANELVQVAFLWLAYYYILVFFRGTRGAQVLIGLCVLIFVLLVLTQLFHLDALAWILNRFWVFLGVAVLVIFQPEIRYALAELGRPHVFGLVTDRRTVIDHIVQAVRYLAEHKIGALIAVEREVGTRVIQQTGVSLDAPLVPELLASIFFPHTPLHDGGVIIGGNRILAAGCVFPLSQRLDLHKTLGTRHRAAVGMSEETDAVVIAVSEETGGVSVCYKGRLSQGMDPERLRRFLEALSKTRPPSSFLQRIRGKLSMATHTLSENRTGEPKETHRAR